MRTCKLAKSELRKIFLRPIMFVVFLALFGAIAILTLNFNPQPRTVTAITVTKSAGSNITKVYDAFLAESNENSKKNFDNILLQEYNEINSFLNSFDTSEDGQIEIFKKEFKNFENSISTIHDTISEFKRGAVTKQAVENKFFETSAQILKIRNYLNNLEDTLNFFIKETDLEFMKTFFKNMQTAIPTSFTATANMYDIYVSNYNFLKKFDLTQIVKIYNSFEYFQIDAEKFDTLIENYYLNILDSSNINNTSPTLNALFAKIKQLKTEYPESNEKEHFEDFETYISQYKSISNMASSVLKNEFLLSKAGNKLDEEMRQFVGFSNFSSYELRQDSNINKYLLENNLFDYEYLTPFSYNVNSGQETNAFDFVVFSMQAISIIIAIFSIFIASGTVANEQTSGTMKMLAIRPYTRTKIITAKLISVIRFMLIMLLVSFAATFAVGYISYGVTQTQSLLIFNAENVFVLNSFLALGIYFISIFLNMLFYIVIALLISVLAKSSTIAIIASILIYVFALLGNMFLFGASWFVYLPIAHLDIFRFFGSKANTGDLFNFTFPLNSNFYTSLIYMSITVLISYLLTVSVFKKRNIA